MTKTYKLTGMTCSGCEAKVSHLLGQLPNLKVLAVSKDSQTIDLEGSPIPSISDLQLQLGGIDSKYQISQLVAAPAIEAETADNRTWLQIYTPILLIFAYILGVTLLLASTWMEGMRYFMAGFFLAFSFFKLLNLKGFAESYAMYDVIAMRFPAWGYIYAFLELGLGIAYVLNFQPFYVNWLTLIVMSISIIGVLQTVLKRQKIKCACLGAIFNLPMSTVTIVEDGLMIVMSLIMLIWGDACCATMR